MVKVTLQIFFLWQGHVYESRLASIPIHARYVVIFTSILLKNSSFLFSRVARFRSESGCKDKAFSRFPPNLSRSFFELFFRAPFKGHSPGKIVVNIARTPPSREIAVPSSRLPRPVLAGAKIRQTLSLFQIFHKLFF